MSPVRSAFVLAGGGSLGAIQAGMLLALAERHIRPDLVVGTSVGALNGAWIASRPGEEGAAGLIGKWRKARRRDFFPVRPVAGLRGLVGKADHLVPADRLRRQVTTSLDFDRLEEAPTSLAVVAADALTGEEVVMTSGDAVTALMASAAIPAVFPPVSHGGRLLVDGGVAALAPIGAAVDLGATTIWVLPTGIPCACPSTPRGAIAMAVHAGMLALQHRIAIDAATLTERADLHIVPPPCPIAVSPLDFTHTDKLIAAAYDATRDWLAGGHPCGDAAARLVCHGHRPDESLTDAATERPLIDTPRPAPSIRSAASDAGRPRV